VPQRIGRVVIVPSWLDEPIRPDELALSLDPGMAFGTGLHPTTRGCLTLLQEISPMPPVVLDVGSGSGILALAALRLGAERAVCYDTDSLAVEATLANAAANDLADQVNAILGSLPPMPPVEPYPLVLANLVAAALVDLAEPLAAHTAPGGTLLASGIIETRADEVLASLTAAGFVLDTRLDDGEWVSLRLRSRVT
jgi:ribosomal protein L11 methyltransferase